MEFDHRKCLKNLVAGELVTGELIGGKVVVECMRCPGGKIIVSLKDSMIRIGADGKKVVDGEVVEVGRVTGCNRTG